MLLGAAGIPLPHLQALALALLGRIDLHGIALAVVARALDGRSSVGIVAVGGFGRGRWRRIVWVLRLLLRRRLGGRISRMLLGMWWRDVGRRRRMDVLLLLLLSLVMESGELGAELGELGFVLLTDLAVLRLELVEGLADDVELVHLASHFFR